VRLAGGTEISSDLVVFDVNAGKLNLNMIEQASYLPGKLLRVEHHDVPTSTFELMRAMQASI
jgi:hypothetical protein